MIPLYSVAQIREWDHNLIRSGLPSHTLMEIAGKGAAEYLHSHHRDAKFQIFCGPGNNGGDGYVIARWLILWGHTVEVVAISPPQTNDSKINAKLCPIAPISIQDTTNDAAIVIDAIFGTGQSRAPTGDYASSCTQINLAHKRGIFVYALDIPTGINPETGSPFNETYVHVDGCLSFGKPKLPAYRNADFGRLIDIDIGFDLIPSPKATAYLLESIDISAWLPKEKSSNAKWNRGHVAIIARGGAAVLCAHAAFLAGAGLVSIICSQEEWVSLHGLRPEVMRADDLNPQRHDAVVLGPGIEELPAFSALWKNFPKPMVVDAGGIHLLAKNHCPPSSYIRILTPHSAEAAALLGISRLDVERDPFDAIRKLQSFGLSILKGPYTKIGCNPLLVAPKGSSHLATAGSGDILAGMVAAFLAKDVEPTQAVSLACVLHAKAGEQCITTDSATDILQHIRAEIITAKQNT